MAALTRLQTALAEGAFSLPEGGIAVFRPGADIDLSPLPKAAVRIVHGFAPDCAIWSHRGYAVDREAPSSEVAVVCVPRSKALARHLLFQAVEAAPGGLILVDGQKTDGVDSLFKAVRARVPDVQSLTKAHGRLFWFRASTDFGDWAATDALPNADGFYTLPGVFSEGGVDEGSATLAEILPKALPGRVADLGAGWGFLSVAALERADVISVDLVEAEALALDCARLNVGDPRARFHWADVTMFEPDTRFDHILCNPPFHTGRAGAPELGLAFIDAAARMLAPKGSLWLVANRHLPYEAHLRERFRHGQELTGTGRFKIFHASRPVA